MPTVENDYQSSVLKYVMLTALIKFCSEFNKISPASISPSMYCSYVKYMMYTSDNRALLGGFTHIKGARTLKRRAVIIAIPVVSRYVMYWVE